MMHLHTLTTIALLGTSFAGSAAFFDSFYLNKGDHFASGSASHSSLHNWQISSSDIILGSNFISVYDAEIFAIKPGQHNVVAKYNDINPNSPAWLSTTSLQGNTLIGGTWPSSLQDHYVTGNFVGDSRNELLVANPDGRYQTFAMPPGILSLQSIQFANNGDIDPDDKLIAGDFDGNGLDELLLVKTNGSHFNMRYNAQTNNWDIISSGNNGSIFWWRIAANDQYVAGDYNGDGRDELIAINTNGWHHSMAFVNNQWQYIGGGSSGAIANWDITQKGTHYLAGDFDTNGHDELLAINPNTGWANTLRMNTSSGAPSWQSIRDNNGHGRIATTWTLLPGDSYRTVKHPDRAGPALMAINPMGWMSLMEY